MRFSFHKEATYHKNVASFHNLKKRSSDHLTAIDDPDIFEETNQNLASNKSICSALAVYEQRCVRCSGYSYNTTLNFELSFSKK